MPKRRTTLRRVATKQEDRDGVTYFVPHRSTFGPIPYALDQATHYEHQEIRSAYVNAQSAVRSVFECAWYWLERLGRTDAPGARRLNAAGGSIPVYVAQELTLSLVELEERLQAVKHRLAWAERGEGEDWTHDWKPSEP